MEVAAVEPAVQVAFQVREEQENAAEPGPAVAAPFQVREVEQEAANIAAGIPLDSRTLENL